MVLCPETPPSTNTFLRKEHTWYMWAGAEQSQPQGGQTRIEALTPRGLSISWCFTGIRIIHSAFSEERREGERLATGSTTQEQAGQEVRRGFQFPFSHSCLASQNGR